jgi:hypothetical protein
MLYICVQCQPNLNFLVHIMSNKMCVQKAEFRAWNTSEGNSINRWQAWDTKYCTAFSFTSSDFQLLHQWQGSEELLAGIYLLSYTVWHSIRQFPGILPCWDMHHQQILLIVLYKYHIHGSYMLNLCRSTCYILGVFLIKLLVSVLLEMDQRSRLCEDNLRGWSLRAMHMTEQIFCSWQWFQHYSTNEVTDGKTGST